MRNPFWLLLLLSFILVAACNGAGPPTPGQDGPTPVNGQPGGAESVSIIDFGYEPATVSVSAGTTVTWTNDGAAPHTVTFADEGPDSGNLDSGQTFQHTFDTAGSLTYSCTIHPAMTGVVNVGP